MDFALTPIILFATNSLTMRSNWLTLNWEFKLGYDNMSSIVCQERREWVRWLALLITTTFVAGCAGPATNRIKVDPAAAAQEAKIQRENYVRRSWEGQARVQDVASPILTGNVELCGEDIRPYIGMIAANTDFWPKEYRDAAISELNASESVQVLHVVPIGPAHRAGLQNGDVLVTVAGQKIPAGKNATEKTANILGKHLEIGVPAIFHVQRSGQELDVTVTPVAACAYAVALVQDDAVNAYADGDNVYITSGMLRFAQSDNELATVVGHELAHDAMGHIDKKTTNFLLGSVFDVVAAAYGVNTQGAFGNAGGQSFSQDFEAEADYVGLYAAANGGYPVGNAADFWRRMGENAGTIDTEFSGSHPGTAERYLALEQVAQEIAAKREAQPEGPLRPNFKTDEIPDED